MSLPLPRRIAQAALLLGAAAAPLIGAGAAHAAALPQQGLGGLSNLDTGVQNTSHQATVAAGQNGEQALRTALPAADRVAGTLTPTARPARPARQRTRPAAPWAPPPSRRAAPSPAPRPSPRASSPTRAPSPCATPASWAASPPPPP